MANHDLSTEWVLIWPEAAPRTYWAYSNHLSGLPDMSIAPLRSISLRRVPASRIARVSAAPSPYADETVSVTFQIAPVYKTMRERRQRLPSLSFSAQLLELGMKYNVEGLVQKAHDQLSYDGAQPYSAHSAASRFYEKAQDSFPRDTMGMVERRF